MAFEKFHHKLSSGTEITLPRMGQIPGGIFRKLRKEDEGEQFFGLLERLVEKELLTEEELEALDEVTLEEQGELMKAWQSESEVSLGESGAS